jgi:transposase
VKRAYTFRLRPTVRQHVALGHCLASHRELYNAALQERRDAWRLSRTSVAEGDQSAQLKDIRKVRPDAAVWSFSSQQATLPRLHRAFAGFYRRAKAGETPGYPRFPSVHRFDRVEWPKDGDGCRWQPDTRKVQLQGIGQVKVSVHRRVEGKVKTIQTTCDGQRVPNPGWGRVAAARLGLRANAEAAGPVVIDVDPRHTSDRGEACGHTVNADAHAARNLLRAGPARLPATPAA